MKKLLLSLMCVCIVGLAESGLQANGSDKRSALKATDKLYKKPCVPIGNSCNEDTKCCRPNVAPDSPYYGCCSNALPQICISYNEEDHSSAARCDL